MGPPKKIGVTGKACAPETTALPPPAPSAPAPTAAPAAACPRSALQHAYLMSNTRGWRELRSARRSPSLPALPRPPCVPRPPVVKLCRIQTIGADAERMQLRCTMRTSLLASPEGSGFACGPWLRGSDLHLTNRERVGRHSSYPVDDRSSKLTRAKSGGRRLCAHRARVLPPEAVSSRPHTLPLPPA
jgi:hypothetical protein